MKYFYNLAKKEEKENIFEKTDKESKVKFKDLSKEEKKKKILKISGISLGVILILSLFFYLIIFKPAYKLYKDGKQVYADVFELKNSASKEDYTVLKEKVDVLQSDLIQAEKDYSKLKWVGILPFFGKYYKDGEMAIDAGKHGLIATELILNGIEPFANVFGFKVSGVEETLSADEKMEELVKIMPSLLPSFDAALEEIDIVEAKISEIDPDDYPESFKGYSVREQITSVKKITTQVKEVAHNIRPMLEKLPTAMGESEAVNYLILFQNDKELRPTGGFITAYALIQMDGGKFKTIQSEDIYNIDHGETYSEISTPEAIERYLVPGLYMRDSNFSPDFRESMETFEIYYQKLGFMPEIEGIIGVDTEFVRSFLEVTGPIYIPKYGETFEASNIVYELELYSEKILSGSTRKDLLGELMGAMVDKVFKSKSDQWKPLLDQAVEEIGRKHMLFYFHDETMQSFAEDYNFAGRIVDYEGDYLHVSDANLGGLKSDYWVEREVKQKINIEDDGTVNKEVEITFYNRGQYDGWLNSTTRTYTRIYVPLGSELITAEGGDYEANVEVYEDLGKTVFANFTRTKPLSSQTIKFVYKLPFKVTGTGLFSEKSYNLLVQKQPGLGKPQPDLNRPKYSIEINGELKEEYEFLTDSEFQWEL